MSRSIVLSNGELAVALDRYGEVRDLYYPRVGYEDHVRGRYVHRVGVWVDGQMSWLSDDLSWQISISCEEEALSSSIVARHPRLKVELAFNDIVYNERPVFVRKVIVTNQSERARDIKLYFGHQFEIYKSHGGDTAFFDPASHAIIHYKGHRVFLISATLDGAQFGDYATGRMGQNDQEGTHRDADDGALSKNPIEHGPADSVIGLYASYSPGQSRTCLYWLAAAQSIDEAHALSTYVVTKTPEHLLRTATDFWRAWINANAWDFKNLAPEHVALFKHSLMYMRAAVDAEGGIIASIDSDMLQWGYDTYCYVWPRDAAYTAMALDDAGDTNVARRFFEFCRGTISPEGYFPHKFLPDKSLGSSWHPWIKDGVPQLPIQEDETAIVLIALHDHYLKSRDLEFLEDSFNTLVEKAADFMVNYRDEETRLPQPSYDLWERKRGISTYTSSAVYGALNAAAELSRILGKSTHEVRYREAASEIRDGILKYLWDEKSSLFVNMIDRKNGTITVDKTVDISSAFGIFAFGVLPVNDLKLQSAWDRSVRVLSQGISAGGIARFQGDDYFRVESQAPGNPWVITTLWYGEYLTANARTLADLDR
ncbi:MAG TPA: glycoside hydrolase family 15 protein, partial [Candidatus Paceibacterota bacterium]|nr:glycoside hydrolase family 15 protein [Candidatus Paceibacterota bacterium]